MTSCNTFHETLLEYADRARARLRLRQNRRRRAIRHIYIQIHFSSNFAGQPKLKLNKKFMLGN